jgi:hypothetical protein
VKPPLWLRRYYILGYYQLEDEVIGDSLEEVDVLDEGEEEVVRDAGADRLGQHAHRLQLLQPFRVRPQLEAQVRDHLPLQPFRHLVPLREARRRLDRVPLRQPISSIRYVYGRVKAIDL